MAPEMILGKGYLYSVDLWGLGVILYEMLYKTHPFLNSDATNLYSVVPLILQGKFNDFPYKISEDVEELLKRLLSVEPLDRGSIESLKNDEWFSDIDWDFVYQLDHIRKIQFDIGAPVYEPSQELLANIIDSLESSDD